MRESIESKIADRRSRLLELERERFMLEGEIRAYEDVLLTLPGASDRRPAAPMTERRSVAAVSAVAGEERKEGSGRRRRRLSGEWADGLRHLAETRAASFGIDAVAQAVGLHGLTPTRGNIRSQMASYVERGIIARVSQGEFRITDAGFAELGLVPLHEQKEIESEARRSEFDLDRLLEAQSTDR